MKQELYKQIAQALQAHRNCGEVNNRRWIEIWGRKLSEYDNCLPSGSGIDNGCHISISESKQDKIVITFSYHFIDQSGMYDGWEDYKLTLRPDFINDFTMRIVGKNRDDAKDYFFDTFDYALRQLVD